MFAIVLWGLGVLLSIPALVVLGECLVAALPGSRSSHRAARASSTSTPSPASARPTIAVLVPAHNEAAGIGRTVADLDAQLTREDRLLVVADNCTDDTAARARFAGAEVVERIDPEHRSKAYALRFGLEVLGNEPRDVVVIVDADCRVEAGALDHLAHQAMATGGPVQAAYHFQMPAGGNATTAVSAMACLMKNIVRPTGLHRLRLPCLLAGSGMAFPWPVIRWAPLAVDALAEDVELGLALARTGRPPTFCPEAVVRTELPVHRRAALSQRRRWEHGYLGTLLREIPRLWGAAIARRSPRLACLALELGVPPLSLMLTVWVAALAVGALAAALGWATWWPVAVLGGPGAMLMLAALVAWARFGRPDVPLSALLIAPLYVLGKVPIYLSFLTGRQKAWVRTERADEAAATDPLRADTLASRQETDVMR